MQNFRSDKKITPKYNSDGLITTVIQNSVTKKVLMVGFMNSEAFKLTLEGPYVWFYSRSRKELWKKGETSGNYLKVVDISIDCDEDALLISVNPIGPTCHNNTESCFDKEENSSKINSEIIDLIFSIIKDRAKKLPDNSYTTKLVKSGKGRISQKIVEESGEVAVAIMSQTKKDISEEMADLIYHLLVGMHISDLEPKDIYKILRNRNK